MSSETDNSVLLSRLDERTEAIAKDVADIRRRVGLLELKTFILAAGTSGITAGLLKLIGL